MAAKVGQNTIRKRLEAFPRGLGSSDNNPENAIMAMHPLGSRLDINGDKLKCYGDAPSEAIDIKVIKVFDEFLEKIESCMPKTSNFDRNLADHCKFANQVAICIDSLRKVVIVHTFSFDQKSIALDNTIEELRKNMEFLEQL